nr:MAG TPA: hypothetical protein [Caudoviricetes sp.]
MASPSSVAGLVSDTLRAATRSRRPNRFGLSLRHTDYVRRSIPLT